MHIQNISILTVNHNSCQLSAQNPHENITGQQCYKHASHNSNHLSFIQNLDQKFGAGIVGDLQNYIYHKYLEIYNLGATKKTQQTVL